MDDVVDTVNGNLDFDNLNQEILTFSIEVDSTGVPITNGLFRIGTNRARGFIVLSARNLTNSNTYPEGQPFISFTYSGNTGQIIKILNITGLQENNEYELTIQVIGN